MGWATAELGRTIVAADVLAGATSSDLYLLTDDRSERWVLRLFTKPEWLDEEPDLAAHEAAALEIAARYRYPSPRLVAVDETGDRAGAPAVLMTKLTGRVELRPGDFSDWIDQQVAALVALDELSPEGVPWKYRSWHDPDTGIPQWSTKPQLWESALSLATSAPDEPGVVLHRDFHPCNVLWQDDAISGVVDWVNLCVGPRSVDVAHCAINLTAMYGHEVADDFVRRWETITGRRHHPYWDLITAVDWLGMTEVYPPWETFGLAGLTLELVRERMELRVARAVRMLA